jgi:hypothetical protein
MYENDKVAEDRLAKALRSMRNVRKQILLLSDDVRFYELVRTCELLNRKMKRIHHAFEVGNQIRAKAKK